MSLHNLSMRALDHAKASIKRQKCRDKVVINIHQVRKRLDLYDQFVAGDANSILKLFGRHCNWILCVVNFKKMSKFTQRAPILPILVIFINTTYDMDCCFFLGRGEMSWRVDIVLVLAGLFFVYYLFSHLESWNIHYDRVWYGHLQRVGFNVYSIFDNDLEFLQFPHTRDTGTREL